MKTIGVVITDGVGYRNFILSDFIQEAQHTFEKVVVFSCIPKEAYAVLNLNVEIVELEVYEESFITWFARKNKEVAHLQLHAKENFGIQSNLVKNYSHSKNIRGFATRFAHRWTKKFHSEKWIQRYYSWQQQTFKSNPITKKYIQLLKQYQVDLLFFTHQRPPYIAPLIYAAEAVKVKTAAFIFSWDNLASKGRMAGNFDYYLVWSALMKKELLQYYTQIEEKNISVVGTPQFEPYVLSRYGYSSDIFFKRFDLDATKPTILFSCGDISTSPNDTVYIKTIAEAILEKKIEREVNFIVRVSPAEEGKRFESLVAAYSFIRWNFPKWEQTRFEHQEMWSQRVPTPEDVSDLKSLLQYCDVSVNMLSTMSLDAMLFDKPVVNTVFGNGTDGLGNDQKYFKYEHIKKVLESGAVRLTLNDEELIAAINESLQHPALRLENQKKLLDLQIGKPLEGTSKRIAETLKKWS
ncbi:hypothetical protein [Flavobacterium suncheonense]|uniref:hypothetical protein n=1 Tax=Flavobacterium suncheonense TaxID=350894 RepID=UPI003FA3C5EC